MGCYTSHSHTTQSKTKLHWSEINNSDKGETMMQWQCGKGRHGTQGDEGDAGSHTQEVKEAGCKRRRKKEKKNDAKSMK